MEVMICANSWIRRRSRSKQGATQPTGMTCVDGVLSVTEHSGTVSLTATKDSLTTDKTLVIDVIADENPAFLSDISRYTAEIATIDVSQDIVKNPPLSFTKSLDTIELTKYRASAVTLTLSDANGYYDPDMPNNFWDANALNPGGYQEPLKIYRESLVNGVWRSVLVFSGVINEEVLRVSAVQVSLTAQDISVNLEKQAIASVGDREKWLGLHAKKRRG